MPKIKANKSKVKSSRLSVLGEKTSHKLKYKRNFLKEVIARIDFAAPIAILPKGLPKKVINALKTEFPVPESKVVKVRAFTITPKGTHEGSIEKLQWFYYSKNREKVIHITDDCMYVQYKKYESFECLQSDFLSVVKSLFSAFDNLQVQRLGLRYIDSIELLEEKNPFDWHEYLDGRLLASLKLADDPKTISRAFNILEFNYGEYNLRFQYGMHNPDYPSPIRKKIFTLDYDAYCTLLLTQEEIANYLNTFHKKLKSAFEEVITQKLRDRMEVVHA